ncbi:GMC oxidoreductase [Bipolaris oryzae ATCC 44560]|uniref:GMC oxidoreductase n=1 Tax=Bipolaris oryzae ATCC 44560 TaxID=930090 RepID=W6YXW7_COCMI|nr:GMC oxidoreductase [Bipolaris oryzae ATCC 44560]EUC42408.1 GMC oxidoreductase [Bipolaris oryzae ATCC 44560]
MPSPLSITLTVAISATGLLAHPLFNGKLISRADDLLPEYDYVVVGAGASGLTVANRLSEDQNVKVLVIEAGQFDQDEPFVTIPGLAGGAVGTKYDWNLTYSANPQVNNRSVPIPLGKVVGGSTKLNRMVFDRGSQSDYDTWEALGNWGWNFRSILPGFIKSETFTPPTAAIQAEYGIKYNPSNYGTKGYIQTTFSSFFWPTIKNFINAAQELGIPINDQATGNAFGGYFCPHNIDTKTQTRSSAEEAYYASAQKRSNFHLLASHQVTRILTGKANGVPKVTGVQFAASAGAKSQQTKVKKEAILAAGALHTPQLLQVSGIGDPAHLASINVPTVVNLPAVGHNLHDHVSLFVLNQLNTTILTSGTLQSNATFAAEARKQYDQLKTGPLTSPTGDFLMFLPVSTYSNATKAILSQAIAAGPSASLPNGVPAEVARGYAAQFAILNKKLEAKDAAFLELIWADGAMILGLQHPYSRGYVKAASANIFDAPIADAGFLRNAVDITLLREGLRFARKVFATRAVASLKPTEIIPGPSVSQDKDIDSWVRNTATTLYHPAGTCKMGPRDQGGVVDQHLHVYGVQGLRIVDASTMPMLPAAHTMTTVYSVAEKAAGIIKGGF